MARTRQTPAQQNISGSIQTQTNSGTAGGTMSFVNLGGLKIAFGATANNIGTNPTPTLYTVVFPTGFFTNTPVFTATLGPNNSSNQQILNLGGASLSNTGVGINVYSPVTTTAEAVQWIAIGT